MNKKRKVGRYAEFKAEWKAAREREPAETTLARPRIDHIVTAGRLLDELVLLYKETRDVRFVEARNAVYQSGLLDRHGSWRRRCISRHLSLSHRSHEAIVVLSVWERMKQGESLRVSCAHLVALWSLPGQSFEAACKEVERLYRSYVRSGVDFGQLADEIKSNDGSLRS